MMTCNVLSQLDFHLSRIEPLGAFVEKIKFSTELKFSTSERKKESQKAIANQFILSICQSEIESCLS